MYSWTRKTLLNFGSHLDLESRSSFADGVIRRLQSVLHATARLITGIRRYEHITPTRRDALHWLPISQRITFKIVLMMFDCSHGRCPKYFGDCALLYTLLLHIRDYDQQTTETSSFHVCGQPNFAAAVSACVDWQFLTNFHRICKAQTLGNSLSIALSTGYSSVLMAGGASDRCWLKARRINGLACLPWWRYALCEWSS